MLDLTLRTITQWAQVVQGKTPTHHSATKPKDKTQVKTQFPTNKVSCSKTTQVVHNNQPLFRNQMLNQVKLRKRKLWIYQANNKRWRRRQLGIPINHLTRTHNIWVRVRWVLVAHIKTHSTATLVLKKQTTDNKTVPTKVAEVAPWHRNSRLSSKAWRVRMR